MENNNPIKYSDLIKPDDAIQNLINQLDALQQKHAETQKAIKDEAIQITASLNMVSGATEQGRQTTKKAATDADRLVRAQQELKFAESESAKKLAELNEAKREQNQINKLVLKLNQSAEGSYNRLSAQYSLNKIYINNMTKAERENTAEGKKLVQQTREIYEEMKRLQEATGKHQLNVGNYTEASDAIIKYGDRLKETLHLNNAFGDSLLALGRNGEESKAAFTAIQDGIKALGSSLLGLLKNPVFLAIAGVAGVGAGFKFWYDYNAGLVEATKLTADFTGKTGDDLKSLRNEIQAVADTFNLDFKETIIASNAVAKQFGITADEALKLVKDGLLSGGNANGEFLDTLKEYPAYFKEAGLSASQFVAITTQASKSGIFSDKAVDAIKEGNLRIREMTTATAAALEGIGISAVQVQKDLQSGAKTTFEVMQQVSEKLNELPESSSAVGTAIADIFGGPGEDAGLQYLKTLKDISTDMDVVKDKAGNLAKIQEEQLQSEIDLQNALSGLFDLTGGNFESMTAKAKIFVNNGIIYIIKGVVSLINYFIELYNESVAVRAIWNTIVAAFKSQFDLIGNLFNYFIDLVKATGKALKAAFTLDLRALIEAQKQAGKAFVDLINAQLKDVRQNINEGVANAQKKINPLVIPVTIGDSGTTPGNVSKTSARGNVGKLTTAGGKTGVNAAKTSKAGEANAVDRNIALQRKAQDIILKGEADTWEKQIKQAEYYYGRQIEDLKKQLLTEKNLTLETRAEINRAILSLHTQLADELLSINEKRIAKEKEDYTFTESELFGDEEQGEKKKDLYSMLGFDLSDDQKDAINTSLDYAKSALYDFTAAQLEAANAAVANADKEVESAERALDAERMARANGLAANVETAQKELNMAKRNQREALKEQEKAKKQQLAIQSIEQIGNMVTASSLIWSQLGFPSAIPAIAVMWASFAASKIKAVQAVNAGTERYGEGTVELLEGGSHQSGNDIDMGRTPDGRHRRAEGGEFFAVINKRNSRRYRSVIPDVIRSLNDGSFANKYANAYTTDGLTLNVGGNTPDIAELKDNVRAIREQNERRTYVDGDGHTVQVYKNLTRRIN